MNDDKVTHKSGATSSYCPRYDLIPLNALNSLAQRFELGLEKHGKDNWRKGLPDVDYCLERLNHVIRHAMTLQLKLQGKVPWDGDDDAGAILWGGAFATEATAYHRNLTGIKYDEDDEGTLVEYYDDVPIPDDYTYGI